MEKRPNHSHAWKGSWKRPMKVDEDGLHPFTVARMTDHNVKGSDRSSTDEALKRIPELRRRKK
jgi:hypothetical protein